MTHISCGQVGEGFYIEAAGHSGFGEQGRDVVCAGVSTLIFTAYYYLQRKQSEGYIDKLEKRETDGFVSIYVRCAEGEQTILKTAFEMALTGFEMLAENFPQCVMITVKEKKE